MDRSFAPVVFASCVIALGLLWLAVGISRTAASRPGSMARGLLATAGVLAACGLWWPVQVMRLTEPLESAALGLRAWLPSIVLASLACATVALTRIGAVPRWWARRTLGLRVGTGALAAVTACVGAASSVPRSALGRVSLGPEWLVMVGLLGIGAMLLMVLRRGGQFASNPRAPRPMRFDSLTGLPTRLQFEDRLHAAAIHCDSGTKRMALLFIDLDGFKPVNNTFGHSSGDKVLEQIGERLNELSKGQRTAARVGGDEFLMMAFGIDSPEQVAAFADRVIESIAQPCRIDDREVAISCSVGVALYPDGKCHWKRLIARADAAKSAAKRAGGSRHCFYTPEMDAGVQDNFDLSRDLRRGIVREELELYFQPKIDALSGKVTAAEALVRWNHPTRGLLMPREFIPLAQRCGLIGPLGNWVIEAACKQARAWRDKGLRMRVAINLTACQMHQDDIADRIEAALSRHRIPPPMLTCEITESAAMEDTSATQETFRRLGELGAHLSIDDFGTGYSSLSYLRQLPAKELKIDASFVRDVDHSADARAVVDAVVKLAHALGLKVVAEGVETVRQRRVLLELGCDELQGFLFARPMTARALLLWAMEDRTASEVFRDSLFGESCQASLSASLTAA